MFEKLLKIMGIELRPKPIIFTLTHALSAAELRVTWGGVAVVEDGKPARVLLRSCRGRCRGFWIDGRFYGDEQLKWEEYGRTWQAYGLRTREGARVR